MSITALQYAQLMSGKWWAAEQVWKLMKLCKTCGGCTLTPLSPCKGECYPPSTTPPDDFLL